MPSILDFIFTYSRLGIENTKYTQFGKSDHAVFKSEYIFSDKITMESGNQNPRGDTRKVTLQSEKFLQEHKL